MVLLLPVLRRGAPAGGGECAGGGGVRACQRGSGFVWDEAPGVEGYKRMGARRWQSLSEVWLAIIREIVGLSGSGRLPDPWVVEERG
jgi:hypothetical protein